ncbi:MAG: hypothetical protein HOB42_09815 [Candidatus Marinimicrobia bacterium]|jgi:metal-responsive CopG/Arc/MetJ family transcriptional regulator|nr:hypothetical protein [Candidatus Neomarinimicrobiota bacterium]MBT6638246.1 hypothetical protein [Candidatus Neomarinimicrobiota bacterium]
MKSEYKKEDLGSGIRGKNFETYNESHSFRLSVTLPTDLKQPLLGFRNKSAFVAEAIREKLGHEQESRLVRELKEGYLATVQEDQEICSEWDVTSGDGL